MFLFAVQEDSQTPIGKQIVLDIEIESCLAKLTSRTTLVTTAKLFKKKNKLSSSTYPMIKGSFMLFCVFGIYGLLLLVRVIRRSKPETP